MSAHEMTVDPMFDFNPELPDYSNLHVADRVIECSPSLSQFEAPWRVELPSGGLVRGRGNTWPFSTDDESMPANLRIVRVGNTGPGEVLEDNAARIEAALDEHNATVPVIVSRGGCAVQPGGGSAIPLGVALALGLGLVLRRRRR